MEGEDPPQPPKKGRGKKSATEEDIPDDEFDKIQAKLMKNRRTK